MSLIYKLSWHNTSFLSKFVLFIISNMEFRRNIKSAQSSSDQNQKAECYSALSSTYYSIAGTAFAKLKSMFIFWLIPLLPIRLLLWFVTWLPLAVWCYIRMSALSDKVVETVGYSGMTAEQCDIRQTILRRCGQYQEAETFARLGLQLSSGKNPCTEALLRIGLADIEYRKKDYRATEECIKSALTLAVGFDMKSPEQAIRVYRHCVSIAEAIPASQRLVDFETRRHVMRIHQLLQYTCANDQRLKFRIG